MSVASRITVGALAIGAWATVGVVPAGATLPMRPCWEVGRAMCGDLTVPLDHSGAESGSLRLRVSRLQARSATRPPLLVLMGGPGEAATPVTEELAAMLDPDGRKRDLIVFDQRGTGESGAIDCDALERTLIPSVVSTEVIDCARALGPAAAYYTTPDSVADMEAVRRALEIDRWAILGISYGTKVALAYAAAHPERVDRLVLDSIVAPTGPDPLLRSSFVAIRRVLGDLCRGRCGDITPDPVADTARVMRRIRSGEVRGVVHTPSGRTRHRRLTATAMYALLVYGDFDPTLRAGFPAAARSAARGDAAPMLRLAELVRPPESVEPEPTTFSYGLWTATMCQELAFPWDPQTEPGARRGIATQRVAALGAGPFAPFDGATALSWDPIHVCEHWPAPGRPSTVAIDALRQVSALLIAGRADIRTPLEDARLVAAALGDAKVIPVRGIGHSAVAGDSSGCALDASVRYLDGRATTSRCSEPVGAPALRPLAPARLARVPAIRGVSGRRGRTLRAVELTLRDMTAELEVVGDRQGGLRGGRTIGSAAGLRLKRLAYVPGVRLTGMLAWETLAGTLRIAGPAAARGTIRVSADGSVTGTLAGRRVRSRFKLARASLTRRSPRSAAASVPHRW